MKSVNDHLRTLQEHLAEPIKAFDERSGEIASELQAVSVSLADLSTARDIGTVIRTY